MKRMVVREAFKARVLELQKQLADLGNKALAKPKEPLPELNERIEKLEFHRTTNSVPLSDEKQILKLIGELEKKKRSLLEWEDHQKRIQETKASLAESRDVLKQHANDVSRHRTDIFKQKTAASLGCATDELESLVVDCPVDKVAHVIGKKGAKLKEMEERHGVSVLEIDGGSVNLVGPLTSLIKAKEEIHRIITSKDEIVSVHQDVSDYLNCKGIAALDELRERHPNVAFERRLHSHTYRLKGPQEDIEKAKVDMTRIKLARKVLSLPIKARSAIIGREGATVESIVREHQATVEIRSKDSDENSSEMDVVISGPEKNLEKAMLAIHGILDQNEDVSQTIALEDSLKATLKINKGEGIKELFKKVNDECREKAQGVVSVNFADDGLILKTRAKALAIAVSYVESEISRMQGLTKTIEVDSFIVPAVFGKGGAVVKGLSEGMSGARVEVDRGPNTSLISVVGWKEADVEKVFAALSYLLERNKVKRIPLEGPRASAKYIKPMRSKLAHDIRGICFFLVDEDKAEILIRGSAAEILDASRIIDNYMAENDAQIMAISKEEGDCLLNGGKSSKLVEISNEFDVQLGVDKSDSILTAKGTKPQVEKAMKAVTQFLYGNDDGNTVRRIALNDETYGVAWGKRGRTKISLESKYECVKITGHRGETMLTVRGPEADVERCVKDLLYILATAKVTRRVNLTKGQEDTFEKSLQADEISNSLSVNITVEDGVVVLRGIPPNVEYAAGLVREIVDGVFESNIRLCRSAFTRVKTAFSTNIHVKKLSEKHSIKMSFDESNLALVVMGVRKEVATAKKEIVKLLAFLLDDRFKEIEISASDAEFLDNLAMVETSYKTNATLFYDRDLGRILVSGDNSIHTLEASGMNTKKLVKAKTLSAVISIETPQQAKAIVGKGGSRVQDLESRTECRVKIDRDALTVTVIADTREALDNGKAEIEGLLDKLDDKVHPSAEKHVDVIDIETLQQAKTIVGRGGSRVQDLQDRTKCHISVDKNSMKVTIAAATPEALKNGKAEIIRILEEQETGADGSPEKFVALVDMESSQQASLIIGRGGSRIQDIENRTECEIVIDKKALKVTITARSPKALSNCKAEVEKLLVKRELKGSAVVDLAKKDIPVFIGRKGNRLQEFCRQHEVELKIDDDKCQVIIGGEEEAVESAVSALEDWKIARNKTHPPDTTATQNPVSATIQLDQTEAWLVSALVGKGGGKIKRLRSEAACKIEVDSAAFIITVSASDEDSLQFGLDVTQKAVEAERSRCAEVQISPEKVSAFIGLKGSHVHDFEQLHDVKVKAYKGKSVLRIFGEPSSVVLARAALEEWVKADESATDGASRI
eukprot:scaffold3240_cov187-Amphora_coffeaeformis.AAC.17